MQGAAEKCSGAADGRDRLRRQPAAIAWHSSSILSSKSIAPQRQHHRRLQRSKSRLVHGLVRVLLPARSGTWDTGESGENRADLLQREPDGAIIRVVRGAVGRTRHAPWRALCNAAPAAFLGCAPIATAAALQRGLPKSASVSASLSGSTPIATIRGNDQGIKRHLPAPLFVGHRGPGLSSKGNRDLLAGCGPAPDRRRPALLQDHVIGNDGRQPHSPCGNG